MKNYKGENKPLSESEKLTYKNKILTELYNSGRLQYQINLICYKNHIKSDTFIKEDVFMEVITLLSEKPADEIIEAYENPNGRPERLDRLVALGVTIAFRRGVYRGKNNNPKTSVFNEINYLSMMDPENVSLSDYDGDPDDLFDVEQLEDQQEELSHQELHELLKRELTKKEFALLNFFAKAKKKRGRMKRELMEQKTLLEKRVKEIIKKHKNNDEEGDVPTHEGTD